MLLEKLLTRESEVIGIALSILHVRQARQTTVLGDSHLIVVWNKAISKTL